MNIGIVTTWQERGAAYVSRQYLDVLKNDHRVFIYARGGEKYAIGNPEWDKNYVTWGKKIPIHMPLSIDLADFEKWIKENELDVVFFNEQQWWDPVLLCDELGVKTGAYVDYYTKETVPFFAIYDFLICNTKRHFSVFEWHSQAKYVPWGTDVKIFKPGNLNLINDGLVNFFHSAGVSPERKGTDILIKAFAELKGSARLIIHSQIDLKKFYPDLEDLIVSLENNGRLICKNETVAAPGLYYLGDIYVYPSRLDGIGLTMIEALACGLPLIVPDNGPMNEFADQSFCKLVRVEKFYERNDDYYWPQCEAEINDLKAAMEFYVNNIEKIPQYKQAARKYAEDKLNWMDNGKELSMSIKDLMLVPKAEKKNVRKLIIEYETKRSNFRTKLYRNFPFLFKPFNWMWPIIKKFYV